MRGRKGGKQAMSKVLVIDDSDTWFSAVAEECAKAGFSAIRAMDHDEAFVAVSEERPSLVLVDLLVAAKAGAGFIRRLRSMPQMKDTPMVLASSGTSAHTARQAVGGGAEVVSKDKRALEHLSERLRKLPLSA